MGQSAVERGLLLASCLAETGPQAPLGLRNERILALRERMFGPNLEAVAPCPHCDAFVEFSLRTEALTGLSQEAAGRLVVDEYSIEYRLPDSVDIAYVARYGSEEVAAEELMRRCIVRATYGTHEIPTEMLPEPVLSLLGEQMDGEDPAAAPSMGLTCPECGHVWSALFDVVGFVWREISTAARRCLVEVHELARAYGWTESDVFALSNARRRLYLEMVRA